MTTAPEAPTRHQIPRDTFAVRLILARNHAGDLTIRDAAERCGLNYGSWSNWERGGLPRDLRTVVERISNGLGIDRDWLLWGGPLETNRCTIRIGHPTPRGGRRDELITGRATPTLTNAPILTPIKRTTERDDGAARISRPVRLTNPQSGGDRR